MLALLKYYVNYRFMVVIGPADKHSQGVAHIVLLGKITRNKYSKGAALIVSFIEYDCHPG